MRLLGYEVRTRPITRMLQSQRAAGQALTRRVMRQTKNKGRQLMGQMEKLMSRMKARNARKAAYEVRVSHDGWMITRSGSTLPLRVFSKKPDAIKEAKKLARAKKTHVDVFTRQGSLQMRQSFA